MAILQTFICSECHKKIQESRPANDYSTECRKCKNKKASQARATHLLGLQALTIEERLAKIEACIYDYKPPVNYFNKLIG